MLIMRGLSSPISMIGALNQGAAMIPNREFRENILKRELTSNGLAVFRGDQVSVSRQLLNSSTRLDESILDKTGGTTSLLCMGTANKNLLEPCDIQPLVFSSRLGQAAIGFQGELADGSSVKEMLTNSGVVFHTSLPSEILANALSDSTEMVLESALVPTLHLKDVECCCILITPRMLIGACGTSSQHSLFVGKCGESWLISNESVNLELAKAEEIRRLNSGEVLILRKDGARKKS